MTAYALRFIQSDADRRMELIRAMLELAGADRHALDPQHAADGRFVISTTERVHLEADEGLQFSYVGVDPDGGDLDGPDEERHACIAVLLADLQRGPVRVNGKGVIWVERRGAFELSGVDASPVSSDQAKASANAG